MTTAAAKSGLVRRGLALRGFLLRGVDLRGMGRSDGRTKTMVRRGAENFDAGKHPLGARKAAEKGLNSRQRKEIEHLRG